MADPHANKANQHNVYHQAWWHSRGLNIPAHDHIEVMLSGGRALTTTLSNVPISVQTIMRRGRLVLERSVVDGK